jgi:antirestriction protein ArdC
MSKTTKKPTKSTRDIFTDIVEQFTQSIKDGNNPFSAREEANYTTGKTYSGFNRLILTLIAKQKGFTSMEWTTFKQAKAADGMVKKGEKGTPVFFYKPAYAVQYKKGSTSSTHWSNASSAILATAECRKKHGSAIGTAKKTFVLKHYVLFNAEQTTLDLEKGKSLSVRKNAPAAIKIAADNNITLIQSEAHFTSYDVTLDVIDGVFSSHFDNQDFYHSLIEATKHEKRLDRSLEYEEEEIVKTIGATFLSEATSLGIPELAPDMAEMMIDKLGKNPFSMWKYAKHADASYQLITTWVQAIGKVAA